jgi:hypothetical protein
MDAHGIDGLARSLAGARTRRSLVKGLAAGLAVVATGRFGFGEAAAAGDFPSIVRNYYDSIEKHSWTKAYNYLGNSLQQAQSFDQFVAGFADTAYTAVAIGSTSTLSGGRMKILATVTAWLNDGSPQLFDGYYIVGVEGGSAKILDAHLSVEDGSSISHLCQASQLHTSVSGSSATGHRFADITVTNTGEICTLAGMPSVVIKDSHGHQLIRGKREAGTTIPARAIDTGDSSTLSLSWGNWCGDPVTGQVSASITLPGQSGHLTIHNAIGVPPCLGDPGSASSLQVKPWTL